MIEELKAKLGGEVEKLQYELNVIAPLRMVQLATPLLQLSRGVVVPTLLTEHKPGSGAPVVELLHGR